MSLFTDTGEIDPTKDYFSELVGEGKKYKTNQDAGRALMEGSLTIKQREQELANTRAALAERVKLEELLTKIEAASNKSPNSEADSQNTNGTSQTITPEQIEELLNKKISQAKLEEQAKANEAAAKEKLVQKFGNNYQSRLNEEASKLGMTTQQLDQVAATNPAAFLRLVGAEDVRRQEQPLQTPPAGVTIPFTPTSGERTQKWYKELKKRDPIAYTSREIQMQEHKDAERLGEAFFDV